MKRILLGIAIGSLIGLCVGLFWMRAAVMLLTTCAGGIVGWAVVRGALFACLRGAFVGAAFCGLLVGVGDWMIMRIPVMENLPAALTAGSMIGALHGTRTFRPRRPSAAT